MIYEYFTVNRWTQQITTVVFFNIAYRTISLIWILVLSSTLWLTIFFLSFGTPAIVASCQNSLLFYFVIPLATFLLLLSMHHVHLFLPPPSALQILQDPDQPSSQSSLLCLSSLYIYCHYSTLDTYHTVEYLLTAFLSTHILKSLRDASCIIDLYILMFGTIYLPVQHIYCVIFFRHCVSVVPPLIELTILVGTIVIGKQTNKR